MNEDWENRDGWDGATWAQMFSGPDDDEIERKQRIVSETSSDDEFDDNYEAVINPTSQAKDFRSQENVDAEGLGVNTPPLPADIPHSRVRFSRRDLESKDEVNAFLKYASRVGATILKICENKLDPDDYNDDGELKDFYSYSVYAESGEDVNLDYYRSGKTYREGEKQRIIDSYLSWMHVDQIAFQHKRPPTAIRSVLMKARCAFYEREPYRNPDEVYVEPDQVDIQRSGFLTCRAIEESLLTGRCSVLPNQPLELEWNDSDGLGYFYLRELSLPDQEKVVIFAAGAVSLDSASELSRKLNLHYLTYCIARQQGKIARALMALNEAPQGFNETLQKTRRTIEFYFRLEALRAIKNPLQIWCNNTAYRFDNTLHTQPVFEANAKRFLTLYKLSSARRGFEISGDVLFVVAAICRNYKTIALLAEEGNWLAKWHVHERERVSIAERSSDSVDVGSMPVPKDRSDSISFHQIFQQIREELPTDWRVALEFGDRLLSQEELVAKKEWDELKMLESAIEDREINQRLDEIDQYYDSLG